MPDFTPEETLDPDKLGDSFTLPDGDRGSSRQMSFILSVEQQEYIQEAIKKAKDAADFHDTPTFGNTNSNGNALYKIITEWDGQRR